MQRTPKIQSKTEIIREWLSIHQAVAAALNPLSEEVWSQSVGGKWSPAGQLEHLFTSANAISSALKMPKEVLEQRFGRYEGNHRRFEEVKNFYLKNLKERPLKNNPFGPKGGQTKTELLDSWSLLKEKIPQRLENLWTEEELDRCSVPHPLMGALSMREMLFFTIFHTDHHLKQINDQFK